MQNLKKKYSNIQSIDVLNNDILKFDMEKLKLNNAIIFGNLPYNISSQIKI